MINIITLNGKYLIDSYYIKDAAGNPYGRGHTNQVCGLRPGINIDKENPVIKLFDADWYLPTGSGSNTKHNNNIARALCAEVYNLILKAEQCADENPVWVDLTDSDLHKKLKDMVNPKVV